MRGSNNFRHFFNSAISTCPKSLNCCLPNRDNSSTFNKSAFCSVFHDLTDLTEVFLVIFSPSVNLSHHLRQNCHNFCFQGAPLLRTILFSFFQRLATRVFAVSWPTKQSRVVRLLPLELPCRVFMAFGTEPDWECHRFMTNAAKLTAHNLEH